MTAVSIELLHREAKVRSTLADLRYLAEKYPNQVAFSLGFGREGMVLADLIFRHELPIRVFTIDTGRLFAETHELHGQVRAKYGQPIEVYLPQAQEIEKLVGEKGPESFLFSKENRIECCDLRKVRPLARALQGTACWITGRRASQSAARASLRRFEWDDKYQLVKANPLVDWSLEEVKNYLNRYQVPYNQLHDRGFESIGCASCTRAVRPGEDPRAGRWWWEQDEHKECGLHVDFYQEGGKVRKMG